MKTNKIAFFNLVFLSILTLAGCSSSNSSLPQASTYPSLTTSVDNYKYLIGAGDTLSIFVWRNPDISGTFIVRPDGKVTTSLVEDIEVTGKTPTVLARELEESLGKYINSPRVT
ncbi:MAG: polysaccharide biosynthesis/export family protein, partial [Paraglaciecola chathamensis]